MDAPRPGKGSVSLLRIPLLPRDPSGGYGLEGHDHVRPRLRQSRDEVEVMADLAADVFLKAGGGRLRSHKKSHTPGANRGGSRLLT